MNAFFCGRMILRFDGNRAAAPVPHAQTVNFHTDRHRQSTTLWLRPQAALHVFSTLPPFLHRPSRVENAKHQKFIIDQIKKQDIRESWEANIPTTCWGLSEPLRISDHIGRALANNLDKRIAKPRRPSIVPARGFAHVTVKQRMIATSSIHCDVLSAPTSRHGSDQKLAHAFHHAASLLRGRPSPAAESKQSNRQDRPTRVLPIGASQRVEALAVRQC